MMMAYQLQDFIAKQDALAALNKTLGGDDQQTNSQTPTNMTGNDGQNNAGGQGGSGIQTMVLPDGEIVDKNAYFDHTADANPNATHLGTTAVVDSYMGSSWQGLAGGWMLPGLDIIQPGPLYAYPLMEGLPRHRLQER